MKNPIQNCKTCHWLWDVQGKGYECALGEGKHSCEKYEKSLSAGTNWDDVFIAINLYLEKDKCSCRQISKIIKCENMINGDSYYQIIINETTPSDSKLIKEVYDFIKEKFWTNNNMPHIEIKIE